MKFLKQPKLGFYELEKAKKCALSAFQEYLGIGKHLPRELPTRPILVGLFFHTLMEKDTSQLDGNEDYDFCIDQVRNLETMVLDNPRLRWMGTPSTWKEINSAANAFLSQEGTYSDRQKSRRITNKLTSKSGVLVGRPDYLRISGNEADIREYKSAHIYAEGTTTEKHVRQILYYAYLIFQNFEVERVKGRIIGLAGHESPREILRQEANNVGSQYEEIVQSIASRVDATSALGELASPGSPQCIECSIRSECPAFLKIQFSDEAFNNFRVIRGNLDKVSLNGHNIVLGIDDAEVVIRPNIGISIAEMESLLNHPIIVTYCRTSTDQAEATHRSQIIKAEGVEVG